MPGHEADERGLFETEAVRFYEDVLAAGRLDPDDPRIAPGAPDRAAFDLLVDLGLLQPEPDAAGWAPEDPGTVQARVVIPLSVEGARLLEESSRWSRAFGLLNQAWRRSPQSAERRPVTHVRGSAIGTLLTGIVAEAESEILTAQPQTGRSAAALASAALRDTAALERGVALRTLYQHSARRSTVTRKYVAAVTSRGAEVRTLDEFFNRLIVVDRRVAVIPAADDALAAVAVREPAVVTYLVDIFERAWERARPFSNSEPSMLRGIAEEQRSMTIRMLVEGHSDPVSAKRLGVSPRTYAAYVADLKAEFFATTRFQLGYTMGRRGVTGSEATDDECLPSGDEAY
ncbi:LuxR family transcriptional regulator [Nocardioides pantholopis]|uniref:LuxR family transcriptional regulator n=1 Tax=Nocardioides pantholopis TaxID=2483798 RepID=UPI000F078250|nr:LuxR family transcriptional regulator [Nocardioides pantholopis]